MKIAYLAGGCFWGMEELFRKQPGVLKTEVGYSGGQNDNPTYTFHPGHAETLRIDYDPGQTDFVRLLDFFFRIHDPSTLNRQGNDIGTSYRSAIFYQNEQEKQLAEQMVNLVNQSQLYSGPVVTRLEPFASFHPAEPEHQDYLKHYPSGYTCHYLRTQKSLLSKQ